MWRPWSLRIGRMRTTRTPAAAVAAAPLWTTTISLKSSAPAAARTLHRESILDIGEVTCPNCGDKFSMDWWTRRKQRTRTRNNRTRNAQRPQPACWGVIVFAWGRGIIPACPQNRVDAVDVSLPGGGFLGQLDKAPLGDAVIFPGAAIGSTG